MRENNSNDMTMIRLVIGGAISILEMEDGEIFRRLKDTPRLFNAMDAIGAALYWCRDCLERMDGSDIDEAI